MHRCFSYHALLSLDLMSSYFSWSTFLCSLSTVQWHMYALLGEYKGTQTTSSPEEMMATVSLKDKWGMS